MYLKLIKNNWKMSICKPVELGNTRILTNYAPNNILDTCNQVFDVIFCYQELERAFNQIVAPHSLSLGLVWDGFCLGEVELMVMSLPFCFQVLYLC